MHGDNHVLFTSYAVNNETPQELVELQAANRRLRGIVADMRREMEGFRDPGMGMDVEKRERLLEEENEELR